MVIRSEDGTVVSPIDGREVLKSRLHGGFKTALATLAIAAILILGIPLGMALVKLSLVVLRR